MQPFLSTEYLEAIIESHFNIVLSKGIVKTKESERDGKMGPQWNSQNTHNIY